MGEWSVQWIHTQTHPCVGRLHMHACSYPHTWGAHWMHTDACSHGISKQQQIFKNDDVGVYYTSKLSHMRARTHTHTQHTHRSLRQQVNLDQVRGVQIGSWSHFNEKCRSTRSVCPESTTVICRENTWSQILWNNVVSKTIPSSDHNHRYKIITTETEQ